MQDDSAVPYEWPEIVRALASTSRQLRRALALTAHPSSLSDTEFLLLWICCKPASAALTQGALADQLGISRSQMSGLVERLRKLDLIRVVGVHDRRRQHWSPTDRGRELARRIAARFVDVADTWEDAVTPAERRWLLEILDRLEERACRDVSKPDGAEHGSQRGEAA